jgi:type IV secretory pathway TraG/TraD family ATPase VirD4
MSDRLGTAQWEEQALVAKRYPFAEGKFWLGRSEDATAIGYRDDRHVCLVSGTRGGKGTSVIINNLCFWPGSAVVVDPKGENATVTAARRGRGSEHCAGMGQAVHVLDPFKATQVDESYRSCFNPLADLDPEHEETIDEASRLANAIIVVNDAAPDPYWDEAARSMVKGLILHVLTSNHFTDEERNLITVRKLIQRGAWEIAEDLLASGHDEDKIDPPHLLLWRAMEMNGAFDGTVAGIGTQLRSMMATASKMFQGVLQGVATQTEFLDSPGMRRVLSKSDFKLSELKTRPEGMTLYLSLPQRYMDTHYRWLRMMVSLTTTEMEITRGQPATGHPVLMVLDEFAGLKRMVAIENAVAQIAGFGVKLFFVLQSLEQLKNTYKDNWETFLSNAGVKIFFSIEDHFTRDYVSKLAGETEVVREMRSANEGRSQNEGYSKGSSESRSTSQSDTTSHSKSRNIGTSESASSSQGTSYGISYQNGLIFSRVNPHYSEGSNSSASSSQGTSHSDTYGKTISVTYGDSETTGTSETHSHGSSTSAGTGTSETLHRRPLVQPDELGRAFARIDDKEHPGYPGLALVLVVGANPLVVWRRNYFEDVQFINCFSPHPDHKFLPITQPYKFLPTTRPSAPYDAAKFRKLFDDYWFDKLNLEEARSLVRPALEDLIKDLDAFCSSVENPQWREAAREECQTIPGKVNILFTLALNEKTDKKEGHFGKRGLWTYEVFGQHFGYIAACCEAAYHKSRGVGLTTGDDWRKGVEELQRLVPDLRIGFPNYHDSWNIPLFLVLYPQPVKAPRFAQPEPKSKTGTNIALTVFLLLLAAVFIYIAYDIFH